MYDFILGLVGLVRLRGFWCFPGGARFLWFVVCGLISGYCGFGCCYCWFGLDVLLLAVWVFGLDCVAELCLVCDVAVLCCYLLGLVMLWWICGFVVLRWLVWLGSLLVGLWLDLSDWWLCWCLRLCLCVCFFSLFAEVFYGGVCGYSCCRLRVGLWLFGGSLDLWLGIVCWFVFVWWGWLIVPDWFGVCSCGDCVVLAFSFGV